MTPNEFKAWFDGFTEAFEGRIPTKAQWGRIKERVAEIDGKPVTERIYVDRYVPQYPVYGRPYWWQYLGTGVATTSNLAAVGQNGSLANNVAQQYSQAASCNNVSNQASNFNSIAAMGALGRAEAGELA